MERLDRVKLNVAIGLDDTETELDPQNDNPRGAHGGDSEEDPLDLIIKSFNERFFQGWEVTPEEQRVKFINLTKGVTSHPDFAAKVAENADFQNRDLAFLRILDEVMSKQRKSELDLYRMYAQDPSFKQSFIDTMKRMAGLG